MNDVTSVSYTHLPEDGKDGLYQTDAGSARSAGTSTESDGKEPRLPGAYQRSEQTDRGTDLQRDEYRRKTSAPAAFDASKRQSGRGKISGYLEASDQVIKGF